MKTNNLPTTYTAPRYKVARVALLVLTFGSTCLTTFAASPPEPDAYTLDGATGLIKWLLGCLIVVMLLLAYIALIMTSKEPAKIIPNFLKSFTGADQANVTMDHEYDGIVELDNRMPSWLRMLFWGTIIFAVFYLLHYHVLGTGKLQTEEYQDQLAFAEENYKDAEIPDEKIIAFTDRASLSSGEEIFAANCVSCHLEDGGGKTGPNLTDAYWKHGGGILNVYKTITNGVPQKGMIAWKTQLSSMQRLQVASYVMTFQGTTPASPKEPEGELWGEGSEVQPDTEPELEPEPEAENPE